MNKVPVNVKQAGAVVLTVDNVLVKKLVDINLDWL